MKTEASKWIGDNKKNGRRGLLHSRTQLATMVSGPWPRTVSGIGHLNH